MALLPEAKVKYGTNHGGARPIKRTIEEWVAPRTHDNKAYRGVYRTRGGRYEARACLNKKIIYLGTRDTQREASQLYRAFVLANREILPS